MESVFNKCAYCISHCTAVAAHQHAARRFSCRTKTPSRSQKRILYSFSGSQAPLLRKMPLFSPRSARVFGEKYTKAKAYESMAYNVKFNSVSSYFAGNKLDFCLLRGYNWQDGIFFPSTIGGITMKNTQKLLSIALALAMILSLSVAAFAVEDPLAEFTDVDSSSWYAPALRFALDPLTSCPSSLRLAPLT